MPYPVADQSWRDRLRRIIWLPFSLLWGGAVLAGMSALEFVFRHRQQLKRPQGPLWLLLSVSYWVLVAVFTGNSDDRSPHRSASSIW